MLARSPPPWFNSGREATLTKLLADAGAGERLDRFELIAELASGGMATVYLARASGAFGFQRLFAIKRLHPHLARETEFVEMFLDEARLAAHIHHPNVVPILEVGQSDRGYYLVMDYVEGDTLARLIARAAQAGHAVPHGVVIRVMLDALAGLHAAHELKDDRGEPMQIVHRDVSPQNILVGADGIARLLDFGVARATARLATTRTGQLKGKLAYMAPEQARGQVVDRRADLFACGVVLWEALAVRRLFKGEGEAETLHRVLNDEIPAPSTVRPDVPKALDDICMRALERDVERRYKTAQELADDLERAGRALSCIGSVRDVAECLQQAVGSELSQQREAVRAWLSRSEPSGPASQVPRPAQSVTRIEGQREDSGSGSVPRPSPEVTCAMPSSRPNLDPAPWQVPMTPPSGTQMPGYPPQPYAMQAAMMGAPPAPISAPPEKVSSVSSAVLPPAERTGQAGAFAPAPWSGGAARFLAFVTAFLLVLAAGGAYGVRRYTHARGQTTAGTSVPGTAVVTGGTTTAPGASVTAAAIPTETPATDPRKPEEPSDTVAPPASAASSVAIPTSAPPQRRTTRTRPAASTTGRVETPTVPDDLSNNPYR